MVFEIVLFVLTFPIFVLGNLLQGLYIFLSNIIGVFGQGGMF